MLISNSAQKKDNRMTTDHGVKVQDTDHWLKAINPDGRAGPSLLEDQIAREKIHRCKLSFRLVLILWT